MKSRWKVHDCYFKGPGVYEFGTETNLDLNVDDTGHFEIDGIPPPGLYVFAKAVACVAA